MIRDENRRPYVTLKEALEGMPKHYGDPCKRCSHPAIAHYVNVIGHINDCVRFEGR